ncbi:hypothetical protein AB0C87_24760 [Actinomadura sp. NPDC048021]|uniref:hypothetical protein n=1 Tax=Actinomadura sp. NPDC048021 TaxID=3155385 RepID=UPI0033F4D9D7
MTTPTIVRPGLITLAEQIREEGGATWHNYRPAPVDGFLVSTVGHELTIPLAEFEGEDIWNYMLAKESATFGLDDLYFGAWIDGQLVYLDLSLHVQDRAEALIFGRLGGQLAIWDVEKAEEIRL